MTTYRHDKPAEVIKRLQRLKRHIERDEKVIKDIQERWYQEYHMQTAVEKYLTKHGQQHLILNKVDLMCALFPMFQIDKQIKHVENCACLEKETETLLEKEAEKLVEKEFDKTQIV